MNSKSILSLIVALSTVCPMISISYAHPISASSKQTQSESRVLGTLIVLNENEIAAGNLAIKKSHNKDVKNFAAFMIREHKDNLNKTESLSTKLGVKPSEGKIALEVKSKGAKELASLKRLNGRSFDEAYIKAMVKGHQEALALINNLISKTSNPSIKNHLERTKMHVEHHLEKAQTVEKSLH